MNREHFYQKTWFKNLILIIIPSLISVLGVIISFVPENVRPILIFATLISLAILIGFVIYFGNQDDDLHKKLENQQLQNLTLTNIIAHMENLYKTNTFEISSLSNTFEVWASAINSFANNILKTGTISNKAWDKIKYIDDICVCCRKLIEQYCNNTDDSKVFVSFVSYTLDKNGEEWVHMICHSSPITIRPTAYKKKMKLSTCKYHFADLIKDSYSGIEIALDNNEVRALFKKVSIETDLSQYTQYVAIPLYCKSGKLLGIFQIVTKNDYIIEDSKVKMEKFITDNIIPLSNLIILTDKIYKGLYITPTNINEEE